MKVTDLPEEITRLFEKIPNWEGNIRDEVIPLLLKFWWQRPLDASELQFLVMPSEVAAIWSITNKAAVRTRYVRVVAEEGRIAAAQKTVRMSLYTMSSVKDIKVEPGRKGRKPQVEQKYRSWSPEYREARKRGRKEEEEEAA